MRTTNEEKAKEIRCYLTTAIMADGKTKGLDLLSERNKRCADLINIYKLVEMSALQAMEWKEQLFIEKACEWLKKNMIGLDMGKYPMYSPNFINDFRKVMEE